jgi:hypothetical protein
MPDKILNEINKETKLKTYKDFKNTYSNQKKEKDTGNTIYVNTDGKNPVSLPLSCFRIKP